MEEKIVLRESNPADSEKLGKFFYDIPTQALLDVKIRRQTDFFSLYHRLRLNFHNYILEEINPFKNNEILGTASFIHQVVNANTEKLNISYAFDLRISTQRKAVLNWTRHFLPRLQKLIATEKVNHFITSINLESSQVINAFIRTKQKRTHKPFYELIRKFNMVTIHGFYPLRFKINPFIKVSYLEKKDHQKFLTYLSEKVQSLDLVPTDMVHNLEQYIQESLIYSFANFVVAKDSKDNFVGVCYPLSSSLLQDYFPQSYNQQSDNFRQFLKFAAFFRIGRKLTRPFSKTQKDQTLNFQFLHFMFFEHPEVFQSMVKYAFDNSKQNEFLIYTYEQSMFSHRPPIGTIHSQTPYGLYEIRTPESMDANETPLKAKLKKNIWLDGYMY